ncbi:MULTISPECIES: XdhC family protein [unclassified Leptolyngbya]|uniref:XdhC family protein n=1 Tax=unclassified Leptolyngbya TaxID=2650499 RepID=UPI001681D09B|nr:MULTISPECIES: XdhC family protein [unclassified Leptolyngbya]MBD1909264.1 XdhC family protein [Leptolyngbya sp. FACHB-8]MBD2154317.1 XdhC family protein [Leptolyngbya sp. FACHB-16]
MTFRGLDDRPEWANAQRFAPETLIFTHSIGCTVSHLANHQELYAALVTRGYQYDLDALQVLAKRELPCRYIGMIGSQKRVRQVLQSAEKLGVPKSNLQTIYAPIGLSLGALTPEEIAVSIGAELIMVRRQGSGNLSSHH